MECSGLKDNEMSALCHKLYVELTSSCNLNCSMCFHNNWFDEEFSVMGQETAENLKKLLTSRVADEVFFGGMGEPLLHSGIYEMVSLAKRNGMKTELITNATLLDADVSEKLTESGIDTVWISMDAFSKEKYEKVRRGSLFAKIISNIDGFNRIRKNTKLGIAFVMMKENLSELDKINEFADRYNVDLINLSHVIPSEAMPESESVYDLPYRVGKMRRFYKNGIHNKKYDCCPFIEDNACFIRHDGGVFSCMQLLHNSYMYLYTERRKSYAWSFGNINHNDFREIYNSEGYTDFRKRVKAFEFPCCTICLGCEDRKENLKDCMYNEAPTCGACLWAAGLIRCP